VLIGLGHTARVGKDTVAGILVAQHGFERLALADPLRDLLYDIDPVVRRTVDELGWDEAKVVYPRVRERQIEVGNAARRRLGADVLIRAAFNRIDPAADWAISDVRYPSEAEAVAAAGGRLVRVVRPGVTPGDDVADRALRDFDGWDAVIVNDGTLEDLCDSGAAVVARFREPRPVGTPPVR
jgi:hypothetical protein